ncbi:MAG: serine/threonine protein kinase [Gemmataceae bacterium]|nr:serine/threonine protein kinase [Gemmataceae bacterium]
MERHSLPPDSPLPDSAEGASAQAGQGPQHEPVNPDPEWSAAGVTRIVSAAPGEDSAVSDAPTPPSLPAPQQPAEATLGDFRLIRKLGEGAMASVFKAHQISFDRPVALKVLFKRSAGNPKLVERFYREARVAGRLDHPNIVHGYEVGEANGWHYFAMEYVSGQSLQKVLGRVGRFAVGDALYVVLRAARGLEYAHEQGLVHRDVKPDNILITRTGEVKVADLGMVKMVEQDLGLTQTGHAVGTPWYMPLEQAKNSKDTDHRCDIYALGCVLYALLTGLPPFHGPSLVDVIQAKELGSFPPARQANAEVTERLDLIIAKMTAKQARHRYQSCGEVIRDLEGLELANEALSFLAPRTQQPAPGSDPALTIPAGPPPDLSSLPTGPAASRAVATERERQTDSDVWYVRYKTPEGQPVVRKLTTEQVRELIEQEDFDPTARASHDPKEGFRYLATYREFKSAMLVRVTRQGADRATESYRKLYKEIEEEDERQRQRPEEEARAQAHYRVKMGLQVAGVVGALVGFYLLVRLIFG